MSFFNNIGSISGIQISKPFDRLTDIKWRADLMLIRRSPEQVESVAKEIQEIILFSKVDKIFEETEQYIGRLYENGGWELNYLADFENDRRPGADEIRDLLGNWPSWADDRPNLPNEDDIADLDTLMDILRTDHAYGNPQGFVDVELYSVLALMKIDDAAGFLHTSEKKTDQGTPIYPGTWPWEIQDVIKAGNLTIEAMEIVCHAERELSDEQLRKLRSEQRERMNAQLSAEKTETAVGFDFSALGKDGANKRHAPMRKLQTWALLQYRASKVKHRQEWEKNSSATYKPISANLAAHELKEMVMAHGRTINAILAANNAQRTIAAWIRVYINGSIK